jgi:hypothetical protein
LYASSSGDSVQKISACAFIVRIQSPRA